MPTYVPPIATLRARAAELIGRGVGRGELKAMMAAICAAENAGTPIPANSSGQTWVTEASGIINQADQDALAILVREFAELVEGLSGGGSGPPVFLGPDPSTGDEGVFYSYSIRAEGTLPITFSLLSGSLPTGTSLAGNIISGVATNGALFEFTIRATNSAGTADNDFSILVDGTVPVLSYATLENPTYYYPGTAGFFYYVRGATDGQISLGNSLAASVTGSTPIAFTTTGTLPSGVTVNASTGLVSGTAAASEVGDARSFTSVATNYFGSDTVAFNTIGAALVYWGEWTGAVPGTFTASNITVDLTDDFGDVSPGPRRTNFNAFGLTWEIDGVCSSVRDFCDPISTFSFQFPALGGAKTRVIAIPSGFFTGNRISEAPPVSAPFTALINAVAANADFTPAFPTPYQTGLTINGVPYDIFVITSRSDAFGLMWASS